MLSHIAQALRSFFQAHREKLRWVAAWAVLAAALYAWGHFMAAGLCATGACR
jgi:hypothetical protein